ncbi:DUF6515 family protein [Polaribacter sp. Hel1_85]|uniref:DUF6515 family protein n=1 Tax=Polaribacter sp. Hel1_85 TaxID=1250005 RepID=UPI00052CE3DB|nr:DUF6515 family protein [Polaribacter sp. Hel1_85]KGL63394.1 hypothetical protein PHEL85_0430 [Polaribacter sp. Hel1_85]
MKSQIKIYGIAALLLASFTLQTSAQTRRDSKVKKTTVKRNTSNRTVSKRVPRTKVTYKKKQRKIVSVRNIPNRKIIKHKGHNYYYANNRFYTYSRGRYIVITPKLGFRINILPRNYRTIRFNNRNYYNVEGVFYVQINNEYEVVDPEVGTIVYELPNDYEKVTIDGQTYYEFANILYEKIQVNGTRAYEVVGVIEMK